MSGFAKIPNWLLRDESLSSGAKLVYCVLSTFNPCYPSLHHISRLARLSRLTVLKAIKELETKDIVKVERKHKTNNIYFLRF